MNFLQMLMGGAAGGGELPVEDIVVPGKKPKLLPPQIRQPEWEDAQAPVRGVDPNAPSLVDIRSLLYNAAEDRKAAFAEAQGETYVPKYQNETGKDFKANPRLQFGTRGVLRDIIGNGVDFLGSLLGREPTYRDEKIRDKLYGWDQGPEARAAAIKRVMDYDPKAGMEIMKNLSAIDAQQQSTAATADYRAAQAQPKHLDALGAMAQGITESGKPADAYNLYRQTMQAKLNQIYGDDAPQLPETYDEATVRTLKASGYRGSDVARDMDSQRDNYTKQVLLDKKLIKQDEWEKLRASTRLRVAEIVANTAMSRAEMEAQIRKSIADDKPVVTGKTVDPFTGSESRTYAPASAVVGAPPNPPVGTRRRNLRTNAVETWDGKNWK